MEHIIKKIIETVKPLKPSLVILHGSYAKGNYVVNMSDIDIIVVSNAFKDVDFSRRFSVLLEAFKSLTLNVEAVGYTEEEFLDAIRMLNPFVLDAIEYGIPVLDSGLHAEAKAILSDLKKSKGLRKIENGWIWS